MSDKKKIIFIITKSVWGGAGRYVFDLATVLHKEGHDVKAAMGGRGLLATKLRDSGITPIEIPGLARDISIINELKVFLLLIKLFKREKPDIVHLNSSKAGLGALAARLCGIKKIVFTLHGLALNEERPWYQKLIIKELYSITLILCHKIIAVSNAVYNQTVRSLPHTKKKFIVIHNGVSIEHLLSKTEAKEELTKLVSEQTDATNFQIASLFIGNVAELHPIKGQSFLLEGFRDALDRSALPLYLFILGDGQEKKLLESKIKEFKLERHVFLCGHVKDAAQYLKAFDMFILPSLSEALPYAIAEAGFAGIPVIASNVGGIPEIIEHEKTGLLIEPKSSLDIKKSIKELAFNPHLRKELATNLHKKIKEKFDTERMIRETKRVYNIK